MERMTYWNEEQLRYEIKDQDGTVHHGSITDKLAAHENLEDRVILESGSNVSATDIIEMFFKQIEEQGKEPFKGFRVLTNEDASFYDEWKKSRDNTVLISEDGEELMEFRGFRFGRDILLSDCDSIKGHDRVAVKISPSMLTFWLKDNPQLIEKLTGWLVID